MTQPNDGTPQRGAGHQTAQDGAPAPKQPQQPPYFEPDADAGTPLRTGHEYDNIHIDAIPPEFQYSEAVRRRRERRDERTGKPLPPVPVRSERPTEPGGERRDPAPPTAAAQPPSTVPTLVGTPGHTPGAGATVMLNETPRVPHVEASHGPPQNQGWGGAVSAQSGPFGQTQQPWQAPQLLPTPPQALPATVGPPATVATLWAPPPQQEAPPPAAPAAPPDASRESTQPPPPPDEGRRLSVAIGMFMLVIAALVLTLHAWAAWYDRTVGNPGRWIADQIDARRVPQRAGTTHTDAEQRADEASRAAEAQARAMRQRANEAQRRVATGRPQRAAPTPRSAPTPVTAPPPTPVPAPIPTALPQCKTWGQLIDEGRAANPAPYLYARGLTRPQDATRDTVLCRSPN